MKGHVPCAAVGRILLLFVSLLALWQGSALPACAATETEALILPPAYTELPDCIPPELDTLLPDGLFSPDPDRVLEAATAATDWRYLLHALLSVFGLRLGDAVALLATLLGLLLLAALLARLRDALGGRSGEICGFCLRLSLYAAIVAQTAGMVALVQTFFDRLTALTAGMIPAMGALYAMGGNLGQAALQEELLLTFLAMCAYIGGTLTPAVCAISLSLALLDAFGTHLTLAPLAAQIKQWYTSLLGIVMFLLSLALTTQSVLTGRADTLAMRGAKYAVGSLIPVVGGAVAGTLGTVAESVRLLRGVCGIAGVVLVAWLLLPTLVELLLFRAALRLATTVAAMLGCDGENRLLSEMASLQGYMAAAVAISSVMFLLALALLIHSGVALA